MPNQKKPIDPSTELANLEKDNGKRLNDLMTGRHGIAVQLQPGTFELLQITTYLERLLVLCDHEGSTHSLQNAKLAFAEKAAEVITQLESQARKAKFTNPGSVVNGNFPQK
jgi:hypothetical protein